MSPELLVSTQERIIEDFRRIMNPEVGFIAGVGRFGNHYRRDAAKIAISVLAEDRGSLTKPIIQAAIKGQDLAIEYIGKRDDQETLEERGLLPHEIHTKNSPQDRLIDLEAAGQPVILHPDGKRTLVNFLARDVNSLFRIETEVIGVALGRRDGPDAERLYLEKRFPVVSATLEHDLEYDDLDGDGLVESQPKPICINACWKDSGNAYVREDGSLPQGPYKYLTNNADWLASLRATRNIAQKLGYFDLASEMNGKFVAGVALLHKLFWMEDLAYFSPLIEGDGRQLRVIQDDFVEGLWLGIFYEEFALAGIRRLQQPDLFTPWGIRTRSSDSAQFIENGYDSYQLGTVWGKQAPYAARGCESYGDLASARNFDTAAFNLVGMKGDVELICVPKDCSRIDDYEEFGLPVACNPHGWTAAAMVDRHFANRKRYRHVEMVQPKFAA